MTASAIAGSNLAYGYAEVTSDERTQVGTTAVTNGILGLKTAQLRSGPQRIRTGSRICCETPRW